MKNNSRNAMTRQQTSTGQARVESSIRTGGMLTAGVLVFAALTASSSLNFGQAQLVQPLTHVDPATTKTVVAPSVTTPGGTNLGDLPPPVSGYGAEPITPPDEGIGTLPLIAIRPPSGLPPLWSNLSSDAAGATGATPLGYLPDTPVLQMRGTRGALDRLLVSAVGSGYVTSVALDTGANAAATIYEFTFHGDVSLEVDRALLAAGEVAFSVSIDGAFEGGFGAMIWGGSWLRPMGLVPGDVHDLPVAQWLAAGLFDGGLAAHTGQPASIELALQSELVQARLAVSAGGGTTGVGSGSSGTTLFLTQDVD